MKMTNTASPTQKPMTMESEMPGDKDSYCNYYIDDDVHCLND